MNFAQIRFWALLLSGFALIWILRLVVLWRSPTSLPKFDKTALVVLGFGLLASVSWVTFAIFVMVALGTYFGVKMILKCSGRMRFASICLLIAFQLAPLCYFKYSDFVVNTVFHVGRAGLVNLLI